MPGHTQRHYAMSCAKVAAIWIVDSGGPKEAQVQSYSPGGANVPSWHIGATWQIRLNHPSVAAMWP